MSTLSFLGRLNVHVRNRLARVGLHRRTRKGPLVFAARKCRTCGGRIPYTWSDCNGSHLRWRENVKEGSPHALHLARSNAGSL